MANAKFRAIVLDLFDTLVRWEPDRLPMMEINGRKIRTTMPWVFPKLQQRLGSAFDRDAFIEIYTDVLQEITIERDREGIEITCLERFVRTLTRIDAIAPAEAEELAEDLTRTHMALVRAVTSAPPERADAVRQLSPYYRLGLLSNFDDAQCG